MLGGGCKFICQVCRTGDLTPFAAVVERATDGVVIAPETISWIDALLLVVPRMVLLEGADGWSAESAPL
jgi:hypothetical protein